MSKITDGCLTEVINKDLLLGVFTIPEDVTSIGADAFRDCTNLTRIAILKGVTSIGARAFWGCTNLTSISISEGVTSIGAYAFYGCESLTSISIPESVTSIGASVFWGCENLSSISIPEGVTSIGEYAFSDCTSLTRITIPEGVMSIGADAFWGCTSLTSIIIITQSAEEFERIKSLLPDALRSKAKDFCAEIGILEGLISASVVPGKEQEWMENVKESIADLQSIINGLNSQSNMRKEQQKSLDSLVVKSYIQQGEWGEAINYFRSSSGVSSAVAFELINFLWVLDNATIQKYQAIISLFKEYDEERDIRVLLEKSVLCMLSVLSHKEKAVLNAQLSDYGIDRCLSYSALIKTLNEIPVREEDDLKDLRGRLKGIENKSPLQAIKAIHELISSSPLRDVFEKRYGSIKTVTYESLIALSDPEEIENYKCLNHPVHQFFSGDWEGISAPINREVSKKNNTYEVIATDAIRFILSSIGTDMGTERTSFATSSTGFFSSATATLGTQEVDDESKLPPPGVGL